MGWREHAVVDAASVSNVDPTAAPIGAWLGVLGQTGFTAWVGLRRTAEMRPGEIVFISAAAGAVGSAAGRFAKLLGAERVVGSAGGAAKVATTRRRPGIRRCVRLPLGIPTRRTFPGRP